MTYNFGHLHICASFILNVNHCNLLLNAVTTLKVIMCNASKVNEQVLSFFNQEKRIDSSPRSPHRRHRAASRDRERERERERDRERHRLRERERRRMPPPSTRRPASRRRYRYHVVCALRYYNELPLIR